LSGSKSIILRAVTFRFLFFCQLLLNDVGEMFYGRYMILTYQNTRYESIFTLWVMWCHLVSKVTFSIIFLPRCKFVNIYLISDIYFTI